MSSCRVVGVALVVVGLLAGCASTLPSGTGSPQDRPASAEKRGTDFKSGTY